MTRDPDRAGEVPRRATTSTRELRDTLAARNRQIAAVHVISRMLSSSLDLEDRLRDILTVSLQAVGAVAGTIFLHRAEDETLVFRYVVGEKAQRAHRPGHPDHDRARRRGLPLGPVADHQPSARGRRARPARSAAASASPTETILTVPLKYQAGRPVGVLQILNKQTGEFDQHDLEVLEIIASVAAAAIETAQLARQAQTAAIAHAVGDLSHDIKNKVVADRHRRPGAARRHGRHVRRAPPQTPAAGGASCERPTARPSTSSWTRSRRCRSTPSSSPTR